MLKKLLCSTLCAIMIFSCMSIVALADSAVVTDLEPNNDAETAQVIDTNVSVEGTLYAPDWESEDAFMDIDAFKFTLTERSKITFNISSNGVYLIPVIMDSLGEEGLLPEIDDEAEEIPQELLIEGYLPAGEYFIMIFDMFAEEEIAYTFTMSTKNAVETLKKEDGVWKYYVGGEFCSETTLVKYSGKWFYVQDGIWNSETTTLAKHKDVWFYIKNGKWVKETTLVKYKDKWFYVKNGKWDSEAKTLVKYKGVWFYVKQALYNLSTYDICVKDLFHVFHANETI